ncbi:MAG TPA: serine peptidase, partial [Xanthobacteraceae bacterium]|nr:serine peptidase [Xanthobacteraceae bacterium]
MTANAPAPRRVLAARRLVLLASVAGLGAAVLFAGPGAPVSNLPSFAASARADTAQRPVGFADIVEKVKPSVISVRVKVDGGSRTGLSSRDLPPGFEQFFRRFGMPDIMPDEPRTPHGRNLVMGQGSGFFISA